MVLKMVLQTINIEIGEKIQYFFIFGATDQSEDR